MKRKRPSDVIREIVDRRMLINERVRSARILRPVGNKREVVFDETCQTPSLVSTTTPRISSTPGSQLSVLGPRGGGEALAVEATIVGRNVGSELQGHTIPIPEPSVGYLGLRATSWSGGNLVIDIASFDVAGAYGSTLHTGVTLSGLEVGIGEQGARRQLLRARSIVGVAGITDGSILMITDTGMNAGCSIHIIDITTGSVASRAFTGTEITPIPAGDDSGLDRHPVAVDYFDDEIYAMFKGDASDILTYEISQIVKWPADLSSETILGGNAVENMVHSGGIFFADEALHAENSDLTVWNEQNYLGGFTQNFMTFKPDPGRHWVDVENWPAIDLGLADGKHWTLARENTGAGIQLSTVTTAAVVASSGWTNVSLGAGGAYTQEINGDSAGGAFDFNAARDTIIGFPVWTSVGDTLGIMSLPITAASWDDVAFVEAETDDFEPDAIIADARG